MEQSYLVSFYPILRAVGAAFIAMLPATLAFAQQQTSIPSVNAILQALDSNRQHYQHSVPSFYCREHLESKFVKTYFVHVGGHKRSWVEAVDADSTFRVKREPNPDGTSILRGSRRILDERVNGRPVSSHHVEIPSILVGAFTGGLSLISSSQQSCLAYSVRKRHQGFRELYQVDFATVPQEQRTINCILQESATGYATVDPQSMQITHVEIFVPYHQVIAQRPDGSYLPAAYGPWHVEITYAPITLDKVYWTPSEINAKTVTSDSTWTVRANYSRYHKLVVTSRIVP